MKGIYKSAEGERAIRERYVQFLERWPVPNQHLRVPTVAGETFIVACGAETKPPLLLFHGSAGNAAMWMGDIAAWSAHFRVYAIDMIGEPGLSAPSRPPLASEAYALWLDEVMLALSIDRASLVGVSLGGWLAIDYATRRPDRVERAVVMCPAGVGRQKIGVLIKVTPLRLLGGWGVRKAREMILGRAPDNLPPAVQYFIKFVLLIHENFRPRVVKIPVFTDAALKRLNMPVMVIVGAKDVLLDSAGTKRRFERNVPLADIRYLPEADTCFAAKRVRFLNFSARLMRHKESAHCSKCHGLQS